MKEWNTLHGDDIQQRVAAHIDKTPYIPKQYSHTMVDLAKKMRTGNSSMPTKSNTEDMKQINDSGLTPSDIEKTAANSTGDDAATVTANVKKLKTQTLAEEAAEKNAAIPTMPLSTADFQDEANDELVDTFDKMGEKGKSFSQSIGGSLTTKGAELTVKAVPAVASAAKTVVGFQGEQMTKAAKVAAKAIQDHGVHALDIGAYWLLPNVDSKTTISTAYSDLINLLSGVQDLTAEAMEAAKNSLKKNKKPKETPQPQPEADVKVKDLVDVVKKAVEGDPDLTNAINEYDPSSPFTNENLSVDPLAVNLPNTGNLPPKRSKSKKGGDPKSRPKRKPSDPKPHQPQGVKTKTWNAKTGEFE